METIELGVKFVRGWGSVINNITESNTQQNPADWLATNTGDINLTLIAGLILLILTIFITLTYIYLNRKQALFNSIQGNHVCIKSSFQPYISTFDLKKINLNLTIKIILTLIFAMSVICIIIGISSTRAHASNDSPLVPDKTEILGTFTEEGNAIVDTFNINNKGKYKYTVLSCSVQSLQQGLEDAHIIINGFDGILYEGVAGQTIQSKNLEDINIKKSKTISFKLNLPETYDIESLFDKQIFKISLKVLETAPTPWHDNLYEYTPDELKQISDWLAENYEEDKKYPYGDIRTQFRSFRDNGLTIDGSDNGVDMINNPNKSNHWAIDANNRIASDPAFDSDSETTIQARIIGICEDYADSEQKQKIGLTFMTTHALIKKSPYHDYSLEGPATYGWAGSEQGGSCTLRSFLNRNVTESVEKLFPIDLQNSVVTAAKGYQYSSTLGYGTSKDKFWAPSMFELYGQCSGDYAEWWPNNKEGYQYKSFSKNKISYNNFASFTNIDKSQSGTNRFGFVWSRSLRSSNNYGACGVNGYLDGQPGSDGVGRDVYGVVTCFCFGTELETLP